MNGTVVVTTQELTHESLETALIGGDLSKLRTADRLTYYAKVCESVGLNPLTRPLEYITLNGRLTLYARRDCTEQLRKIHGVSVESLENKIVDGVFLVTAKVKDKTGRTDVATGAVTILNAKGDTLANLLMKAETKAKRRATLSICGLGLLDESEIETLPPTAYKPPETAMADPQRKSLSPLDQKSQKPQPDTSSKAPGEPEQELHFYRIENLNNCSIKALPNKENPDHWTVTSKKTGFIFTVLDKKVIDAVLFARDKGVGIVLKVDPSFKDKKMVVDFEKI